MSEEWITYADAADRLGITAEAVRHRARRLKWRTQPGNDGKTLVLIPEGAAVRTADRTPVRAGVQTPVQPAVMDVLQARLATVEAELAEARRLHQGAVVDLAAATAAIAAKTGEITRLDAQLSTLIAAQVSLAEELAEARAGMTMAQERLDMAKAELAAERALPWWRRMLGSKP